MKHFPDASKLRFVATTNTPQTKMTNAAASPQTNHVVTVNHDTKGKTLMLVKLIFIGLFLPSLDFGTDLLAIYQHAISPQWILNRLAMALTVSILSHNLVSSLYGWRNWDLIMREMNDIKFARIFKFIGAIFFALGLGNILVTIQMIKQLVSRKNNEKR